MPSGGPRQLPEGSPLDAASVALHESVQKGNPGGLTRAIKRGADIESRDPETGETVLMLAGRLCNFKIVDTLLKAGASVSTPSVERYTALHTACLGGNTPIVRLLLKKGASVTSRTKFGDTPLISASIASDKEIIDLLLDAGADVNACDQEGRTGLMWASTGGRGDVVAWLLAAGAKHDLHDDKGAQALHNAAEKEQLGAMAALIRAGADPNGHRSNSWDTPLHVAVKQRRLKAAMLLLRAGALVDAKNYVSMTPLHRAVCDGYTGMVSAMLSYIRRQDKGLLRSEDHGLGMEEDSSAAGQRSRRQQQQQQQQQHGGHEGTAGPNMRRVLSARNIQGWTPLHIAAMVYSVDIVNLLLRYGALETEQDRIGKTPFLSPVRCVQGNPIPFDINGRHVAPDIGRAYGIVQSLSRARASRARSWPWPTPASASEGGFAAPPSAAERKHKKITTVRGLGVTNSKRNSIFLRAVSRYVETKGRVILDDGRILAPPPKPSDGDAGAGRQLAVV